MTEEQILKIRDGNDSLRWLLNIADPEEGYNPRVTELLDETHDSGGVSTRARLEMLWETLTDIIGERL